MLENSFKIALDPLFPPPLISNKNRSIQNNFSYENNKF
jgi:hypothetical protein